MSRRTTRRPHPPRLARLADHAADPIAIRGLGEALSTCWGITDRFGQAHASALLTDDGDLVDLVACTEPGPGGLDDAVGRAAATSVLVPAATRLVLFSVGLADVRDVDRDDLDRFARWRTSFAAMGVELVDWICSDADQFRSMAFTVDPDQAWGGLAAGA